ncbi:MAG: hypothetical protein WCG29_10930 [Desulfomonile sp.]
MDSYRSGMPICQIDIVYVKAWCFLCEPFIEGAYGIHPGRQYLKSKRHEMVGDETVAKNHKAGLKFGSAGLASCLFVFIIALSPSAPPPQEQGA